MFRLPRLPRVLFNLILEFAFDATREQVKESLEYILFMKELKLHPATLSISARDFSDCPSYTYSRETKTFVGYFAPWQSYRVDTPFRNFFCWFSKKDLYDCGRMRLIISDLDFRMVKSLFRDFPIKPRRDYKYAIKCFIDAFPEEAAICLSPIFRKLKYGQLLLTPTSLGRFIVSSRCAQTPNWAKFGLIHL